MPHLTNTILYLPLRANATDIGPNGLAVINNGGVTFSAAGAAFSGANSLEIAHDARLEPQGDFTLALSFLVTSGNSGVVDWGVPLVAKGDVAVAGSSPFSLMLSDIDPDLILVSRQIALKAGDTAKAVSDPAADMALNVRHTMAFVVDKANLMGRCYLDGALMYEQAITSPVVPHVATNLFIGSAIASGIGAAGNKLRYTGSIRDLMLVGRAWGPGDVRSHYNSGGVPSLLDNPPAVFNRPRGTRFR